MSEQRRRDIGDSDAPVEDELAASFDNTVTEGAERLHRTFRALVITGLFGGLEIGVGVMAYLAVLHQTGDHLLAGLAFSAGFVALILGHSEVVYRELPHADCGGGRSRRKRRQLLRLWSGTLLANLAGGWLIMWLITQAFPQWNQTLSEFGQRLHRRSVRVAVSNT